MHAGRRTQQKWLLFFRIGGLCLACVSFAAFIANTKTKNDFAKSQKQIMKFMNLTPEYGGRGGAVGGGAVGGGGLDEDDEEKK